MNPPNDPQNIMNKTTISPEEVQKFSAIADEWWNPHGKFAPLHRINPLRINYITQQSAQALIPPPQSPLKGLSLLDIGCGGGLIAEPMARLGANVTAIDASEKNIAVAKLHAEQSSLDINYRCMTAEELAKEIHNEASRPTSPEPRPMGDPAGDTGDNTKGFDIVLALEIIEHVADIDLFMASVMQLVKPGGTVVLSTINRTAKAYALAIVGAEYILRWLPRGTHDWNKFVTPSELRRPIEALGGTVTHTTGMVMNPLTFEWSLKERDLSVNYLLVAKKDNK